MLKRLPSSDEPVCLVDQSGRLIGCSESFSCLFDCTKQTLSSLSTLTELIPNLDWPVSEASQRLLLDTLDGELKSFEAQITPITSEHQTIYLVSLKYRSWSEYGQLAELCFSLQQSKTPAELAERCLETIRLIYPDCDALFFRTQPRPLLIARIGSMDFSPGEKQLRFWIEQVNPPFCHVVEEGQQDAYWCCLSDGQQVFGLIALNHADNIDAHSDLTLIIQFTTLCLKNLLQKKTYSESNTTRYRVSEAQPAPFNHQAHEGVLQIRFEPGIPTTGAMEEQREALVRQARIGYCNDRLAKLYGYDRAQQLIGQSPLALFMPEALEQLLVEASQTEHHLRNYLTQGRSRQGQLIITQSHSVCHTANEHLLEVWLRQTPSLDSSKQSVSLATDPITDLPDRQALLHQLGVMIENGRRGALILIDLDNFKDINDALGHEFGDLVLREIGPRLLQPGRPGYLVCRIGGDKFALLADDLIELSKVQALAYSLLATLRKPFLINTVSLEIDASIGIALFPQHASESNDLLRKAETAMYLAKESAFKVTLFRREQEHQPSYRLSVLSGLRSALHNQEFSLLYQPQMALQDQSLAGFECLLRWNREDNETLSPGSFIPLAEMSHHIHDITRWVIGQCFADLARWKQKGRLLPVSINLSSKNLMDNRLISYLSQECLNYNIPPNYVHIEITESALMSDTKRARQLLLWLRKEGFRISIDDFGTGYSSLAYLKNLPVDILKIDKTFVSKLAESQVDAAIVRSIISMAHSLDACVVAEGVESRESLERLIEYGCDYAQGYYINRGIVADQVPDFSLSDQALEAG